MASLPELRRRWCGFNGYRYSSLSSFAILEPDVVKLDMSLVRGIHHEPVKRKLISSMTTLCKELGVLVVARRRGDAGRESGSHRAGLRPAPGLLLRKARSVFRTAVAGAENGT